MDCSILLVDDDPGMIQRMGHILAGMGQLRFATNGAAALKQARECPPDLVLLDAEMPGMSGFDVCQAMKADPVLQAVPVIFVTGHGGDEMELKCLAMGAADFVTKPISAPLLKARVNTQLRVKTLNDELRQIAMTDALTEVANRRCFDNALDHEWQRAMRSGDPISLLLIDIDHFKPFNDRYGHPVGDACLRSVAQAMRRTCLRPADLLARYGGEEFALLLPNTPPAGAMVVAGRVLEAVHALAIPHEASPTSSPLSVSVGVSCHDPRRAAGSDSTHLARAVDLDPLAANDLVVCADQALYAAKRAGRDRAWRHDTGGADIPASDGPLPDGPPTPSRLA